MRLQLRLTRRYFIARARDAINGGAIGFTLHTVAEVVGHSKEEAAGLGMTSMYAGKEPLEAKAACVSAVKLPLPQTGAPP